MENYDISFFEKGLQELGISLNQDQMDQFVKYYELLVEWNSLMNLTTITEYHDVVTKHFLDSLSIVKVPDFGQYKTIIDVGTGAGFPGIPLKIAFPDLEITLLDSLNKRVNFLNEVINQFGLKNVTAIHGRAEDFAKPQLLREKYDLCVSRAVANLSTLSEYCLPFVKVDGSFISYKSGEMDEEVKNAERAIKILGGKGCEKVTFTIPQTDIKRSFLIVHKNKKTITIYPRKAGMPSKDPLK